MAFTYTGSTAQSITVTSTSGLATQIAQIAKDASAKAGTDSATSGALQTQIDSLQTQDTTMQQQVNDITSATAAFQNQLKAQYAKYPGGHPERQQHAELSDCTSQREE